MKRIIAAIRDRLDRWHSAFLIGIFALAIVFRLVAINWGMPYDNLHPDEGLIFSEAYNCVVNHTFEVKSYFRPNHVMIKLNTLLYLGIQELYFAPQGLEDFAENYSANFPLFTTASRILIAILGFGCVVLAYLIAGYWGRNQALLAAMLFAIFPAYLEHSHYITPDMPLLFFLMAVLWLALRYLEKPSTMLLFGMSFFTALATCEKYPGIFGCAVLAAAVCIVRRKKPILIVRDGAIAFGFLVLGILAISPVLIVDWRNVLEIMAGQNHPYHLGADGLNFGETVLFYLKTTVVRLGLILTLAALYGMMKTFRKNRLNNLMLLAFLSYIIPISMLSVHWERYTLPIYAVGLLFGAIGVVEILADLQDRMSRRAAVEVAVISVVLLLPLASQGAGALAMTGRFLAPDSRILLQPVFAGMNVTAQNTVFDCNTPLDPGGYYGAFGNFNDGDPEQYKWGARPRFLMTSSAQRDLFFVSDPEVYGWIADFYHKLDEDYEMIYFFPVENPNYHFLEFQNIWCSARTVYRYLRGAATGYEIRLYQISP